MTCQMSDFYDRIRSDITNAGQAAVDLAIKKAIMSFCDRTMVYTYTLPAIDIVGNQALYTLTPEAGTRVGDVLWARLDGANDPMTAVTEEEADGLFKDWRTTGVGTPEAYLSFIDHGSIQLILTPDTSDPGGLLVKIGEVPLESTTTFPDWLFNRYADAIEHGAKEILYAAPRKPWTSPSDAVYHKGMFNSWIQSASTERAKGFTRKRPRVQAVFK